VRLVASVAIALGAFALAPTALADMWLPHPANATWTYQWSDSVYAPTATTEQVTVSKQTATTFELAWTTQGLNNPNDAISSSGTADFLETNQGIFNTNWSSTAPPPQFPILCAQAAKCGNALSSVYFNIIWGSRAPVLAEPLLQGDTWTSTGGAANDVGSISTYLGQQQVTVPAWPNPVTAAVVRSQITQAGAIGDPYGSGTRTVWWVYGVGPVKVEFDHAGGAGAPVTTAVLESTNQTPAPKPDDLDYFPFPKGLQLTYSWTNSKYMTTPEVDRFTVDAVANNSARFSLSSVSGPIEANGTYGFTLRADGFTNLWGTTASATTLKFPPLGPIAAAASRRNHFITPFDLMTFGFNPVLTAAPQIGDHWGSSRPSSDFTTYGVPGSSTIVAMEKVTVPAGTFYALEVRSTLRQPGFPFGSGTRTSWFAPDTGLVKLVFDHADGSVSTVELLKKGQAPASSATSTTGGTTSTASAAAGKTVFESAGCGSCHTFAPAGSTGTAGPDLDNLAVYAKKAGKPLTGFVSSAITNPPASYVPSGYPKTGMPAWGTTLTAQQLANLVAFLTEKR
jgi:mono/diheme cytochrome c family protein